MRLGGARERQHFWYNIRKRSPFWIARPERMVAGWELCERLADGPDHIIPGHDPEVTRRFPALPGDPDTLQLHLEPRA
jgi:hypothetical protein